MILILSFATKYIGANVDNNPVQTFLAVRVFKFIVASVKLTINRDAR